MSTPFLEQYRSIKKQYPRELLFFRMGDFYELFFEDAELAARELGITLTSRPVGKAGRIPMAGVPVKAAESYIHKLLEKGYHIAICEQVGEGSGKLMDRAVVEVITPGTVLSEAFHRDKEHLYVAALWQEGDRAGAAVADVSTGEVLLYEGPRGRTVEALRTLGVREVVLPEGEEADPGLERMARSPYRGEAFALHRGERVAREVFRASYALQHALAIRALGGLYHYLEQTKKGMLDHLTHLRFVPFDEVLFLDERTLRNLEVLKPLHPEAGGQSLLDVLDHTLTPMGGRWLRHLLSHPPRKRAVIEERLARVDVLVQHAEVRQRLREILEPMGDLQRWLARASTGRLSPRMLRRFAQSLVLLRDIRELLRGLPHLEPLIPAFPDDLVALGEDLLHRLLEDLPPSPTEGSLYRPGIYPELDEQQELAERGQEKLLELEARERERTGIPNLRVGYHAVFGYYFEVTRSHLDKVPPDYIRKQTLKNVERFVTEELKALEERITLAQSRVETLQKALFQEDVRRIVAQARAIHHASLALQELDVIQAFAEAAARYGYVRPVLTGDGTLEIREGRHPVVERLVEFVPNDTRMDPQRARFFVITGPNMSGKSTYLRQVALITLMAHVGSFVPAREARIPLTDRIFSRIGASDDVARGVSTFMAEMIEVAEILHSATPRSLVILDEVGRGTATYDGLAIAWAVAEYLYKEIRARTLFATHFHELAQLADLYVGVRAYTVEVREWEGEVIFLHRVVEGTSSRSYGVHVARLAGLPERVVQRAHQILARWEARGERKLHQVLAQESQPALFTVRPTSRPPDLEPLREILSRLQDRRIETMTLEEVSRILRELQEVSRHVFPKVRSSAGQ